MSPGIGEQLFVDCHLRIRLGPIQPANQRKPVFGYWTRPEVSQKSLQMAVTNDGFQDDEDW